MLKQESHSFAISLSLLVLLGLLILFWPYFTLSDLQIYKASTTLFLDGKNPYSSETWNTFWKPGLAPSMAWNPPFFFVLFAPFLTYPSTTDYIISFLSLILFLDIIRQAWRLVTNEAVPEIYFIGLPILSVPLLITINFGQLSVLLTWIFISGITLLRNRKELRAGLFFGILLIKPHIFFLSLLALFIIQSAINKIKILLGLILTITGTSLTAEILSPGIHSMWFYRENWPTQLYGSTLSSLFRQVILCHTESDCAWISIIIPAITVAWIIYKFFSIGKSWVTQNFYLIILLSPLVAPYGFIFDSLPTIIPFVCLLACAEERNDKKLAGLTLLLLAAIVILSLLLARIPASELNCNINIWWFTPTILSLFAWLYLTKDPNIKSQLEF